MSEQVSQDEHWIRYALSLAAKAEAMNEIPVGAVVVADDQIIGEGYNTPIMDHDPSAHAEMKAIRMAARTIENYRVTNATLYVTLEPCPMCAGLLVHSRINRLVFGAFDAKTGITYLTEDTSDSAIYRHVPNHTTQPFVGGELQALKVSGKDRFMLSEGRKVGEVFNVEWVSVPDPQALKASTRDQAHNAGAAFFSRGEGAWLADHHVYLCSTDGGPARRGQLYRLDISSGGEDRLTLVAQAESNDSFANPDNVTVSSWGDVFLAEDGGAPNGVRVLKPDGSLHHFARNALNGGKSEIAGICFSPDGKWLFLNLQWEGLTLAITGPFTA